MGVIVSAVLMMMKKMIYQQEIWLRSILPRSVQWGNNDSVVT